MSNNSDMEILVEGAVVQKPTYHFTGKGFTTPVLCREDTYDEYVCKEINRSYGKLDVEGRKVIDVGANIGAFSVWAVDHGATNVMAFEPEPRNFAMLELNAYGTVIEPMEYALTSGETGEGCALYVAKSGINPGNTSTRKIRGRDEIAVDTFNFKSLLDGADRGTVVKMDCEGAEFDLLPFIEESNVSQIAFELHLQGANDNGRLMDQARKVPAMFASWECVVEPRLDKETLWHTLAVYRR